ncbi:unnamed protein product [Amoebophrya sp. A120]|nr:unnamed protein product [Amoebophrya sp. A120]|eukprot:GSA120T00025808001.1
MKPQLQVSGLRKTLLVISNLQKAVRRGEVAAAVASAVFLIHTHQDAELLRRLVIICVEDVAPSADLPQLVWLMVAVSSLRYRLTDQDVFFVLHFVAWITAWPRCGSTSSAGLIGDARQRQQGLSRPEEVLTGVEVNSAWKKRTFDVDHARHTTGLSSTPITAEHMEMAPTTSSISSTRQHAALYVAASVNEPAGERVVEDEIDLLETSSPALTPAESLYLQRVIASGDMQSLRRMWSPLQVALFVRACYGGMSCDISMLLATIKRLSCRATEMKPQERPAVSETSQQGLTQVVPKCGGNTSTALLSHFCEILASKLCSVTEQSDTRTPQMHNFENEKRSSGGGSSTCATTVTEPRPVVTPQLPAQIQMHDRPLLDLPPESCLPEAVDFHCSNILQEVMRRHGFTDDVGKTAIWQSRSSLNFRGALQTLTPGVGQNVRLGTSTGEQVNASKAEERMRAFIVAFLELVQLPPRAAPEMKSRSIAGNPNHHQPEQREAPFTSKVDRALDAYANAVWSKREHTVAVKLDDVPEVCGEKEKNTAAIATNHSALSSSHAARNRGKNGRSGPAPAGKMSQPSVLSFFTKRPVARKAEDAVADTSCSAKRAKMCGTTNQAARQVDASSVELKNCDALILDSTSSSSGRQKQQHIATLAVPPVVPGGGGAIIRKTKKSETVPDNTKEVILLSDSD